MGLKDASELIEKFLGGEVWRDAGQDPGYPSVYYLFLCCVGLLLYSIMRRCALLSASQDKILQLHESYMLSWQKELHKHVYSMYRTAQYSIFPSQAILLSKVFGRLKLPSKGSYLL
jgi:hypothetical protein